MASKASGGSYKVLPTGMVLLIPPKKDPLGSFFLLPIGMASKASGGSYKVLLQRRSSHSFAPRNNKLKLFLLPMIKIIEFQLKKTGFKPVFSF